jgi:uncharacterized protein with gpF-like domain
VAVRRRYERAIRAAEAHFLNIIRQEYIGIGEQAFANVADQVGVALSFDLNSRNIAGVIDSVGTRVKGMTEEHLSQLRTAVAAGIDRGLSVDALAKELRLSMSDMGKVRSLMIARTETANAYNLSSLAAYRQSGLVTHVNVFDGSEDRPCAEAAGAVWTIEQAHGNPIAHPNCQRAFGPVVKGA